MYQPPHLPLQFQLPLPLPKLLLPLQHPQYPVEEDPLSQVQDHLSQVLQEDHRFPHHHLHQVVAEEEGVNKEAWVYKNK